MNLSGLFLSLVAVAAGTLFPVQASVNAELARALQSPILASAVSFMVGTFVLSAISVALISGHAITPSIRGLPLYVLFGGGCLGAVFLTTSVFLVPRIGAAALMCLIVAGQLLAAVAVDSFGWLGLTQRELSAGRLAGALMVGLGAVMVSLF